MGYECGPADWDRRINQYALVVYLPGEVGRYLDQLRRELVPRCVAQSHVTILPPRPLSIEPEEAFQAICDRFVRQPPFRMELGEIGVFESTAVIYLELADGREELVALHDDLNRNGLGIQEPFAFHPHVTLAQEFPREEVARVRELAQSRWREFGREGRSFQAETCTFVQNTQDQRWIDLAECRLGVGPTFNTLLTQKA